MVHRTAQPASAAKRLFASWRASARKASSAASSAVKPGDRLVFDRKEGRASRSRVSTRNYSQWMGGSLSFDDTSLADILTNLERWYAVEIDAPEAWTRQVRMSFKLIRNESIEEILKAMSLVVEMDYVCAGRRITIIPKQPKNS